MTIHILTQFAWPDDAPTGLYAEAVAQRACEEGLDVVLCSGVGTYRRSERPAPAVRTVRLENLKSDRPSLSRVAAEYISVSRAFAQYIRANVSRGDCVVITSAPPTTILLHRELATRGATGIYWLQDYYPELLRGLVRYPLIVKRMISAFWRRELKRWPCVVKAAGNLGYEGPNTVTIRNWQTLDLGPQQPFIPKTAVYSGNFGYGHHVPSFLAESEKLRSQGYRIIARADGAKISKLPSWVERAAMCANREDLIRAYWHAEIHLIAGDPELPGAVFPSKFWNARGTGRRIIATGLTGAFAREFDYCLQRQLPDSLVEWMNLLRKYGEPHSPLNTKKAP